MYLSKGWEPFPTLTPRDKEKCTCWEENKFTRRPRAAAALFSGSFTGSGRFPPSPTGPAPQLALPVRPPPCPYHYRR